MREKIDEVFCEKGFAENYFVKKVYDLNYLRSLEPELNFYFVQTKTYSFS